MRLTLNRIDAYVILWARRKFKRPRHQSKVPREWFDRAMATAERREPSEANPGLLWSEINDPLGLACRSFDLARFINHNLGTKPDHGANVRREQLPLSIACGLIGMALTCLRDDAHVIESLAAPQLDQEMRSKAFTA